MKLQTAMSIDIRIPNTMLESQHTLSIMHAVKGLSQGGRFGFTFAINLVQFTASIEKKSIIAIEKAFDKTQHLFKIENKAMKGLRKFFNAVKGIYKTSPLFGRDGAAGSRIKGSQMREEEFVKVSLFMGDLIMLVENSYEIH